MGMRGRWVALGAWSALVIASVPYGAVVGRTLQETALGRWLFGPGMVGLGLLAACLIARWLHRSGAPLASHVLLLAAAGGYGAACRWLVLRPIERIHLVEYGILGALAWWALRRLGWVAGFTLGAALGLAALVGLGDELVQGVTPGRYFDWRDVMLNAASAALGLAVLVAVSLARRSGRGCG